VPNPSLSRRAAALCIAVAFAAAILPERSNAQAPVFPTKPVRILTAFPAGSGPDVALRVVADRLAKKWSQPVIVENRPGGNGFIAITAFKQTSPEGYDLIQLDRNHLATHPHTFSKLPYDPQKDLEPIRPLFSKEMSQLYAAVAVQEVQWALGSAASAGPLEKAGRVRFIAVAGPTRSKAYPGVPSVDEAASTKGYEVSSWTGLFAPKGTPKALREKISADVLEAVKSPEVIERYRGFDYELFDAGPDAYAELIRRDTLSWADIIKAANLKLD